MSKNLPPQSFIEHLATILPLRLKYRFHICFKRGCGREGVECFMPDYEAADEAKQKPDEYYCVHHAHDAGYCWCCGQFWAGVESFDLPDDLCENCRDEFDEEFMHYDDEAIDDYDVGFNGQWFEDPADNPQSILTDEEYDDKKES